MDYLFPLFLAFIAGFSTIVGSIIAFLIKNREPRFCYLCIAFSFSSGVMIFISFTELLNQGIEKTNFLTAILGFFGGVLLIYLIDVLIPHVYEEEHFKGKEGRLRKTTILLTLGILIHNFPEGIAVLFSSISDIRLGFLIAVAIAIHNIPEGIAVSLPIFYSTKNRNKAFLYSFLSGMAEPLGAVIGFLFLYQFLNEQILGAVLSVVSGIMVFISFDELLPYVYRHKESHEHQHLALLGLFLGMFVIALTLIFL